jgi:hypothetical protein
VLKDPDFNDLGKKRKYRCCRVIGKKGFNPELDYERIQGSAKAKASSFKPSS